MDLSEIKYHIELFTQRVTNAHSEQDKQMYTNMLNVWKNMETKANKEADDRKARLAAKKAALRPPGLWLVRIIRATTNGSPGCDTSHSYEIEVHSSAGASDVSIVPLHQFNQEWSKSIRMEKNPYGIRDNGECKAITREEYESRLASIKG